MRKKENMGVGSGRLVGLRREKERLKQGKQRIGKKCVLQEKMLGSMWAGNGKEEKKC